MSGPTGADAESPCHRMQEKADKSSYSLIGAEGNGCKADPRKDPRSKLACQELGRT